MEHEIFEIKKERVAQAFRRWKSTVKRQAGQERAQIFREKIAAFLDLLGSTDGVSVFPSSKSTWHDWAKAGDKSVKLSLAQCKALQMITREKFELGRYSDADRNTSFLAFLVGELKASAISNTPNEDGHENYRITIERIAFRKSEPLRVNKSWFVGGSAAEKIDVGYVTYGLSRGEIVLKADGAISPDTTYLTSANYGESRHVRGLIFSDNPAKQGSWFVDSADGSSLIGEIREISLGTAWQEAGQPLELSIVAKQDWFTADFHFSQEGNDTDRNRSKARKHLLDRLLSLALNDHLSALSLARAKISTEQLG